MENIPDSLSSVQMRHVEIPNPPAGGLLKKSHLNLLRYIKCLGLLSIVLGVLKIANDSYVLGLGLQYIYKGISNPPQPGFAVTTIVYAIAFVYILLGKRIIDTTDKNIQRYLWILLVLSSALCTYELIRPNYPLGIFLAVLVVLIFPALIILRRCLLSVEFNSQFHVHKYFFGKKSWIVFSFVVIVLIALLPSVEKKVYPEVAWKTYQNQEWGFEFSYPTNFSVIDASQNVAGSAHYLMPQEPYEKSGYLSRIVEVADVISTSTERGPRLRGYLQIVLLPVQPKSLEELRGQIKAMIASSSAGTSVSQGRAEYQEVKSKDQNLPAINYIPFSKESNKSRMAYVFAPPYDLFGKPQPSKLFRIDYNPADYPAFDKIISSFKIIPIIPTDRQLYESAEANKDLFWCEKISDEVTRVGCNINVRGYPITKEYPVKLDFSMIAEKRGTVSTVGTSTIVLSATKNTNATSGVAWVALVVNPYDPWKLIKFDAVFDNGKQSEALLNVYWDAQNIGSEDARISSSIKGAGPFEIMVLDNQGIGKKPKMSFVSGTGMAHVLGFRLDTFGTGVGSVTISNIRAEDMY